MNREIEEEFINKYNDYLESYAIAFDRIEKITKKEEYKEYDDVVFSIADNYLFPKGMGFDFLFFDGGIRKYQYKEWYHFANMNGHGLMYILDKTNGKIVAIDSDTFDFHRNCAKSSEAFIQAFTEVLRIEIERYNLEKKGKQIEDKYLFEALNKSIYLAGGEEYAETYKYAIGIGLD